MERLKRFFDTIVQRAFWELRLAEPPVVDHVSTVLADFADSAHMLRLSTIEGERLDKLLDTMIELPGASERTKLEREREMRQYIGDYALFMSGIFRSHSERRGYLNYYITTGQRSYRAVSELDTALYRAGFLLFEDLSQNFERYSSALDYVRKAYFASSPGAHPFAEFLRQVDSQVRAGLSTN